MMQDRIDKAVRNVPDFPKPGIIFKDITTILQDPELSKDIVKEFAERMKGMEIDAIAGVESRGFLFGMALAMELNVPFITVRKKGKLPYHTVSYAYDLEYGQAEIEMHVDAVKPGWKVMIHDDLLATGGTAMVRAAYSSSNPAIGVGPGNAPVFVDSSADIALAANQIVTSKSFDNSVLCTSESNLITLTDVDKPLRKSLKNEGAYICNNNEVVQIRNYLFHPNGFNVEALGRDAVWIARECGIRVPKKTRILVTPINSIGIEEPLAREKLCPVLSFYVANSPKQAIAQSRATLRATGAGHSAVIHSQNERMILDFASRVECYRVVVNASCSLGASGFNTNLAPSFTIGTGFYGRSSLGRKSKNSSIIATW